MNTARLFVEIEWSDQGRLLKWQNTLESLTVFVFSLLIESISHVHFFELGSFDESSRGRTA